MSTAQEKGAEAKTAAKSIPLAVIGMGCLFPKAASVQQYWTNIREGVDAITDIPATHWRPADYFAADPAAADMTYARRGGFLDAVDFDPLLYGLSPNNIEATDSTQLLGMVVARDALLDAGYATSAENKDGRAFDRDRTSVILGVTGTLELVIPLGARLGHPIWRRALAAAGVDADTAEEVVRRISAGYVPWQENSFPGLLGNVAAGRIANRFDLGGTNCVVDAACASSLSAVHMAAMELYSGRADLAITGGLDTFNDIFMYMCFSKTPALSPTGDARPFDSKGDGTILGEGLGAIILKRLDDALRDGDKVYAQLLGLGASSDGRGNAIYAPSAAGQTKALRRAYAAAGVSPRSIALIEAHGTGTQVGDAVEIEALSSVYSEAEADAEAKAKTEGSWCAIGSVKSMIGHTKSAAGIAGMIKVIKALQHQVLPPTLKVRQPVAQLAPARAPVYVNTTKRPWLNNSGRPRRAAVSAFGFGGSNFHCVLEEAPAAAEASAIEWDGQVALLALSAPSVDGIRQQLGRIQATADCWPNLRAAAAQSLRQFSAEHACRLAMAFEPDAEHKKILTTAAERLAARQDEWHTPDGVWFSRGERGRLALLFPGQGSQYVNMLVDLACQFPSLRRALERANALCDADAGYLSDVIYPIPVFDGQAAQQNEARLRATVHAQPAIGAISSGALAVLRHFAVEFDATAGHSFGELTALHAAGRISEPDLLRLAAQRGRLMQAAAGQASGAGAAGADADTGKDPGAMLAVAASAAVLHTMLEAEQLDLVIANHNAPTQVVLSGGADAINQAEALLGARGIRARRLPVAAAFHSSHVVAAERPFADYLYDVEFAKAEKIVFANATAQPYPADINEAKQLLASQLARPVEFVSQIENMYAEHITTFVEVGPGNGLTGLVKAILDDKPHRAIALDTSRGKRSGQRDLADLLAQLSVAGHALDLTKWDAGYLDNHDPAASKPAMTVAISGANHVNPRPEPAPQAERGKQAPAASLAPPMADKAPHASTDTITNPTTGASAPAATPPADVAQLTGALEITQQSILTLQQMQEQTARLHQQYLQGQAAAQQAIQQLLNQQQQSVGQPLAASVANLPPPAIAPAPEKTEHKTTGSEKLDREKIEPHTAGRPATDAAVVGGAPSRGHDFFARLLLEVVAEKTGYPADMLSLEMSLDTDLGIDSIKRVEILSALQERLPEMAKIQPEQLGTFQVLAHIVEYLATDDGLTVTQAPAPPAEAAPAPADVALQTALLAVVAEKTGYPADMLSLEMNLDTDLGIDSIKRVEILSALQERLPAAPAVKPEDLATLSTLQQIIDHLSAAEPAPGVTSAPPPLADAGLQTALLAVVAEKTGYPADMLDLGMNLDTDLGIDSIKRVEILSALQERLPAAPAVKPEDLASLTSLQQIIDHLSAVEPATATTMKTATAQAAGATAAAEHLPGQSPKKSSDQSSERSLWRCQLRLVELQADNSRPVVLADDALILISDDGSELPGRLVEHFKAAGADAEIIAIDAPIDQRPPVHGLIILTPADADAAFIEAGFTLMQAVASDQLQLLAGITRQGGCFALTAPSAASAHSAGISGLVKTADKEWPHTHCKVLDIPATAGQDLAGRIVAELLTAGPLEVGLTEQRRYAIELQAEAVREFAVSKQLFAPGELVVISGGARGVTAEVAVALAEQCKVNLLLLGRSELAADEPDWLRDLTAAAAIKQAIIDHEKGAGRPSPVAVEQTYQAVMAAREIRQNLARIRHCGVDVHYRTVDVRDGEALAACIEEARAQLGPVCGLIHAAGVLADKRIQDKTIEQFRRVFSTKVAGAEALLRATASDALKAIILFSSSTARLGRRGQADYAAANETLNKLAQQQQRQRPDCRVLAMNWGPWDGGMVTPALKQLFAEEGVGLIPLAAGAAYLLWEMSGNTDDVELVVSASPPASARLPEHAPRQASATQDDFRLSFERIVNMADYPVLAHHIINGRAVLPAALIAEWLIHGAIHANPGLLFAGLDDLHILKGIVLQGGEQRPLQIMCARAGADTDAHHVPVELRSGAMLHARATIILAARLPANTAAALPRINSRINHQINNDHTPGKPAYYSDGRLFHGPLLQAVTQVLACSAEGIHAKVLSAPAPSAWMNKPIRSSWYADPALLDAAFQMMILWSFDQSGKGCLPTRIGRYRQFHKRLPDKGVSIAIRVASCTEHAARADMEFLDAGGDALARLDGYECVLDESLHSAFARNTLEQQAGMAS